MEHLSISEGFALGADDETSFSVARWLSMRTMQELTRLVRLTNSAGLSGSDRVLVETLMKKTGFNRAKMSRPMVERCARRLAMAASVEYCVRRDWIMVMSDLTLRKDPRKSVRVLPLGNVMCQVMKGSPLIAAIDD